MNFNDLKVGQLFQVGNPKVAPVWEFLRIDDHYSTAEIADLRVFVPGDETHRVVVLPAVWLTDKITLV